MGEQGGLRTGWIAAFGTEGYDGEPPLLEELGVNFGHIKGKVRDESCGTCNVMQWPIWTILQLPFNYSSGQPTWNVMGKG